MKAIDWLTRWADTWQLKLAPEKCTVCRLESNRWRTPHPDNWCVSSPSTTNKGPTYMVYNPALSVSDTPCDLGVIVDCKLHFDSHISAVLHKAHSSANLILKCFHSQDKELLKKKLFVLMSGLFWNSALRCGHLDLTC